jgi:hypothetical protein
MARLGALANRRLISGPCAPGPCVSGTPRFHSLRYFAGFLDETVEIGTHLLE